MRVVVLLGILCAYAYSEEADYNAVRSKLVKQLFNDTDYDKDAEPGGKINTLFATFLKSTTDIKYEEYTADVSLHIWHAMSWNDPRLAWDPEDFKINDGGNETSFTELRVPQDYIWIPDVLLYSSISPAHQEFEPRIHAILYSTGDLSFSYPKVEKIQCLRVKGNDVDCKMVYASWSFDASKVTLDFLPNKRKLDLAQMDPVQEYRVVDSAAQQYDKYYPCCEAPFPELWYNFTLTPIKVAKPPTPNKPPPKKSGAGSLSAQGFLSFLLVSVINYGMCPL